MATLDRLYHSLSKPVISPVRGRLTTLLKYAGEDVEPEVWLGHTLVNGLAIMMFLGVALYFVLESVITVLAIQAISIVLLVFSSYLILFFKADNRGKAVEKLLPNFLNLVASNVSSGMTPFQAVRASSRSEFGILKNEVDRALSLSVGTMSFPEALLDMTTRVKSQLFRKVIELMIEGMRTGGSLAVLLEDIAHCINETIDLKKEITTRSRTNIMFIAFIILFGAPLLSAVSINFVKTLSTVRDTIMNEIPETQTSLVGGLYVGELALKPEFLIPIVTLNLIVTATIASMLIAIIMDGKIKYFVKYAIILTPLATFNLYVMDYLVAYILT